MIRAGSRRPTRNTQETMNQDRSPAMEHARNRSDKESHKKSEGRGATGPHPQAPAGPHGVERFLDRLRHLSEAERLTVEALEVLRTGFGARRASAWLFDDGRPGFRLVQA